MIIYDFRSNYSKSAPTIRKYFAAQLNFSVEERSSTIKMLIFLNIRILCSEVLQILSENTLHVQDGTIFSNILAMYDMATSIYSEE
jgi:hypothetical protein